MTEGPFVYLCGSRFFDCENVKIISIEHKITLIVPLTFY